MSLCIPVHGGQAGVGAGDGILRNEAKLCTVVQFLRFSIASPMTGDGVARDSLKFAGLFRGNVALTVEIGFCCGISAAYGRRII